MFFLFAVLILGGITLEAACQTTPIRPESGSRSTEVSAKNIDFAVVSVKKNISQNARWRITFQSNKYLAAGASMHQIIQNAYGIFEEDRIFGEPKWSNTDRFDIEAKLEDNDVALVEKLDLEQRRLMIQKILEDRFKLITHRETKIRPVYALIISKTMPNLRESKIEGEPNFTAHKLGAYISRSKPGQLTAQQFDMTHFAQYLTHQVDRQVIDETGLLGYYDVTLDWVPDNLANALVSTSNMTSSSPDSSGPSIFRAIQEQLGLKLVPRKAAVEVLVIDHLERPSAN